MLRRPFARLALIAAILAAPAEPAEIPERRISFAPGAESATIEGSLTGHEVVDYLLNARAGQRANISLGTRSGTLYFNLIPPGAEQWEAVFVGSRDGGQFEGVLDRGGDWRIRLYQMGQARDGGETHGFRLETIVAAGQAGGAGAAIDALVAACADAARDHFGDHEAGVDMRSNGARVDGTETVGGTISLETRAAYVACAFAPGSGALVEFFVDGEDRTGAVTGGAGGDASVPADWDYLAPEEGGPRRWEVTAGGGLRLHEGPSVASPVVATLPQGAILSNLGCEAGADRVWCDVQPFRGGPRGHVAAEFLRPAIAPHGAPLFGPDDSAARAGEGDFDANGTLACAMAPGAPMGDCAFGVSRGGGGDASVAVTRPDGSVRILFFQRGEFVGVDASQAGGGFATEAVREGGLSRIRVDGERYEVVDAIVFGG